MALPKPLTCRISRPIKGRYLVNKDQLSELFQKVSECFTVSLDYEADNQRQVLGEWASPTVEVKLSDGSLYKDTNIEVLNYIETDRDRLIESIEMYSRYGYFTSSIKISNQNPYTSDTSDVITVDGPEEKAILLCSNIERIIKRNTDLTSYVYRFSSFFVSFSIYLLIFITFIIQLKIFSLLSESIKPPYIAIPALLFLLSFSMPIIFAIEYFIVGKFRSRYLKKYAFLWGEDAARHTFANRICYFLLFSLPAGIAINVISSIF